MKATGEGLVVIVRCSHGGFPGPGPGRTTRWCHCDNNVLLFVFRMKVRVQRQRLPGPAGPAHAVWPAVAWSQWNKAIG